ncbi:MAG: amidohydrolase [Oscillibacter sp.]|jgi:aminobenzoyl-glutamate utilization protein B|nr:amidohydrolase [Oscillibacter sp.]
MAEIEKIRRLVADQKETAERLARNIWDYAELSYCETRSAEALQAALKAEGFTVETGIAEIPTAFTASFRCGTGKPVMGLLAEYDALDGLSQKAACPVREALKAGGAGHGCGHNLLGAGCFAAAAALKNYLVSEGLDGTVILFGCPAEEGAGAKQFIARAGYFDGVDFAYTWHPATLNEVPSKGSAAIMGANFIFDGVASHAGAAPHLGRSALDGAELMNVGVNYLREHMIDTARIHYAYSDAGGTAPNVVQSHTVIKYEVRAPKVDQMQELFARVVDAARGAALMTGTKMHYDITMAFSDYVPNLTLAPILDACLRELGAPDWTPEDDALALEFLRTYGKNTLKNIKEELEEYFDADELDDVLRAPLDRKVHPFNPREFRYESGSTDVGDVGYATPTAEVYVATACLGNVGHSWQNTAFSNSQIGMKGMLRAAEVLALACVRTAEQPQLIEKAKRELLRKNGGAYTCPLPEYVQPPIGRY